VKCKASGRLGVGDGERKARRERKMEEGMRLYWEALQEEISRKNKKDEEG
jgi:hypothetical protein